MTFRERLADWISGGAVTRAQSERIGLLETINRMERAREDELRRVVKAWNGREAVLRQIAAMETHGANATVRRMARIAREAME